MSNLLNKQLTEDLLTGKVSNLIIEWEDYDAEIVKQQIVEELRSAASAWAYPIETVHVRPRKGELIPREEKSRKLVFVAVKSEEEVALATYQAAPLRQDKSVVLVFLIESEIQSKELDKLRNLCRGRISIKRGENGEAFFVHYTSMAYSEGTLWITKESIAELKERLNPEVSRISRDELKKSYNTEQAFCEQEGLLLPLIIQAKKGRLSWMSYGENDRNTVTALVGATGSGKSNALNVIIESALLCGAETFIYSGKPFDSMFADELVELKRANDLLRALELVNALTEARSGVMEGCGNGRGRRPVLFVFDEYQAALRDANGKQLSDIIHEIEKFKKLGYPTDIQLVFSSPSANFNKSSILRFNAVNKVIALYGNKNSLTGIIDQQLLDRLELPTNKGSALIVDNGTSEVLSAKIPYMDYSKEEYLHALNELKKAGY